MATSFKRCLWCRETIWCNASRVCISKQTRCICQCNQCSWWKRAGVWLAEEAIRLKRRLVNKFGGWCRHLNQPSVQSKKSHQFRSMLTGHARSSLSDVARNTSGFTARQLCWIMVELKIPQQAPTGASLVYETNSLAASTCSPKPTKSSAAPTTTSRIICGAWCRWCQDSLADGCWFGSGGRPSKARSRIANLIECHQWGPWFVIPMDPTRLCLMTMMLIGWCSHTLETRFRPNHQSNQWFIRMMTTMTAGGCLVGDLCLTSKSTALKKHHQFHSTLMELVRYECRARTKSRCGDLLRSSSTAVASCQRIDSIQRRWSPQANNDLREFATNFRAWSTCSEQAQRIAWERWRMVPSGVIRWWFGA